MAEIPNMDNTTTKKIKNDNVSSIDLLYGCDKIIINENNNEKKAYLLERWGRVLEKL